jgi:hypothetical protein
MKINGQIGACSTLVGTEKCTELKNYAKGRNERLWTILIRLTFGISVMLL